MNIVSPEGMRSLEKRAFTEYHLNESLIIENVGRGGADWLEVQGFAGEVVVLVGPGNNGADGLAMARHLLNRGRTVRAFLLYPDKMRAQALRQLNLARAYGVECADTLRLPPEGVAIDALLGTGCRLPLSEEFSEVIETLNAHRACVVSLDIPTGVDGASGATLGPAIEADYTLAVGAAKIGHFCGEGARHTGELVLLDAGFPAALLEGGDIRLLERPARLPEPDKFGHKYTRGHLLVVGASPGLSGAAALAATAALKTGAGLASVFTWPESYGELSCRVPREVMLGRIPAGCAADAALIGPGLGRAEQAREEVLRHLREFEGPVALDADGINALKLPEDGALLQARRGNVVLTPHWGEFARLMGISKVTCPLEPLQKALRLCACPIVLKMGGITWMGFPEGALWVFRRPNAALAGAGSGDVLAGILGGLLAQGLPCQEAILAAVAAHSRAGELAASLQGIRGASASDLLACIGEALEDA